MGKTLSSTAWLQEFARVVSASKKRRFPEKQTPITKTPVSTQTSKAGGLRVDSERVRMESLGLGEGRNRVPLAQVVSDCVRRWFQDTLKEAKAGDISMQVLVGQMYNSGYGVPRDSEKGKAWIRRASRNRSSAWKVSEKPPGYNASDSDSDELMVDTK